MKLIESSIARPVSVIVGVLFLVLFGLLSLFRIPIQLTPDIDRPTVTISTRWPGAGPEEIEQEVVQRQEEQLKTLEGLVEMTSQSQDSRGNIELEFLVGSDPDVMLLKVSNKLQQVRGYPLEAERPVLTSGSGESSRAIAWMILDTLPGYDDLEVQRYLDFAENVIEASLERVPGVAQGNVFGGYERELQVIVDAEALASRGITINQMMTAITRENVNISAGAFDEGKRRYVVRTVGQYKRPEDVEDVVLRSRNGVRVTVGDVARVELGYKEASATVRVKGRPAIAINCTRETGSNVLDVMAGIQSTIARLNDGPLEREGLILTQVYDETTYITSAIDLVRQNIFVGGVLAICVLLIFPAQRQQRAHHRNGDSDLHRRHLPVDVPARKKHQRHQPGRYELRRRDGRRQRHRCAREHLPTSPDGKESNTCRIRRRHRSLGSPYREYPHDGRHFPARRLRSG